MEEILKAALKVADAADLFWVESRSTPVAFESNRLKHLQTKESRGVGLRIIKGGRIGFSATNRMEDVDGIVTQGPGGLSLWSQGRIQPAHNCRVPPGPDL